MPQIHSSAVVESGAQLGADVEVGPFALVETGTVIGDGCRLAARSVIKQGTTLGTGNVVAEGAVLGGRPQHLRAGQAVGGLRIGNENSIRENVTIHAALRPGEQTTVGDRNLLMVNAHIAHDCHVGSRTIIANNVLLAGHIEVGDCAYLSGAAAAHQFCRIGAYAMVGGQAHIKADVPPYVTVDGNSSRIVGLNVIGLKRNGFSGEDIRQLKQAYRLIYRSGLRWAAVIEAMQQQFRVQPALRMTEFLAGGQRGFVQERQSPRRAALSLIRPIEDAPLRSPLRKVS